MDKYILVQHLNSVNSVISETFKSTQRIKLICFEVSEEYIIFGASSGGIYIFKREPCVFLKLIPSKEGSAIKIAIASNEKNLAIASSKGLIIVLEDFLDLNVRPLIHTEHEGSAVTVMKWHGNSIYSGDDCGRISVFSLSNLLTIFQTASATLMHLDSSIVQIDTYLNYLLVSTKTRTYLCDTEKECYKQIGRKLRDGNFGACFFNVVNNESPDIDQSFKGIFKTIKEDETFTTSLSNSDVKIYCARPGARIWEANFEATVLVTHQFRDSLNQNPYDLLHLKRDPDARMVVSTFKEVHGVSKNFNLNKIYPLLCRFIVAYDNDGIYFFDPSTSKLAFWCNCFKNIKRVVILKSLIYVWQDDLQINIIALELLEELIIKTLLSKQYYLCAELCTSFYNDVINLIEYSRKIHLISILKSKLTEINATDLLEKVLPILEILEKFNKKQTSRKKLKNGIVVIGNQHNEIMDFDGAYIPESVRNFKNVSNKTEESEEIEHQNTAQEECITESVQKQTTTEESINLIVLYKQFQLNKTHKNVDLTKSIDLMNSLNLDDLFTLFQEFIKYVEKLENCDATMWCKEQFLKQASKRDFDVKIIGINIQLFLKDAFLESCSSNNLTCKCNFPLPKAHKNHSAYYNLGCKLMDDSDNIEQYLFKIPYMYKHILNKMTNINDIVVNLPLLVQFNDEQLFKRFLVLFTYDTWDEFIKLYIKLCQGRCLNCESSVEIDGICSWSNLGMIMIQSIGPRNTTRLLKRHSKHIPSDGLDVKFYQCCILASTLDQSGPAVNFMDNVITENILPKFEEQMEKFLQRKYLGCENQAIKSGSSERNSPKCSFCNISLHGSVFSDSKKCNNGHNFHSLCFDRNKGMCNICCLQT